MHLRTKVCFVGFELHVFIQDLGVFLCKVIDGLLHLAKHVKASPPA